MASVNTTLELKFTVCQKDGCSSFKLEDLTGIFVDPGNLGGWGTDNPLTSEVLVATLEITFPDGSLVTVDLKSIFGSAFPRSDGQPVIITNTNCGLTDDFPDGVYIFKYSVSGDSQNGVDSPWSAETSGYFFFSCQTQCALDNLFAQVQSTECDSCKESSLDQIIKSQTYLDAAINAACCGKQNMATKLLQAANFQITKSNCKNC